MTFWGILFTILLVGGLAISEYEKQKKRRQAKIDLYNRTVQGRAIQILESLSLLDTTKNLGVLSRRIDFIAKTYGSLIQASAIDLYHGNISKVIGENELPDSKISLLTTPDMVSMATYCGESIVGVYERYVVEQTAVMNALKTATAKQNRKNKMIEKGEFVKQLFETYGIPDNGHAERIHAIQKSIGTKSEISTK